MQHMKDRIGSPPARLCQTSACLLSQTIVKFSRLPVWMSETRLVQLFALQALEIIQQQAGVRARSMAPQTLQALSSEQMHLWTAMLSKLDFEGGGR